MESKSYFFCGIGGSGMLPLAAIVRAQGHEVKGSDRSLDAGRTAAKFDYLRKLGIELFPQDGSGVTSSGQIVVASAAVEETVPDIVAAAQVGACRVRRADLLAELVNGSPVSIAVGGTSGKSTTTGMIGWILHACGRDPAVMNGAVMKNFASADAPFASALVGQGGVFVSEVDESDGTITLYRPTIAVLNNITLDHKGLEELRKLFGDFAAKAETVVLNLDDPETARIAEGLPSERLVTYSFGEGADFRIDDVAEEPLAVSFRLVDTRSGTALPVHLKVPGRHNAANAVAAILAAEAAGVPLADAAKAIEEFAGLRRRFEVVGTANGVTVIDDFGHNPDKIAATLDTLHAFPGRLLIFFQPHGYGPLKVMKDELIACFRAKLGPDDVLILSDPAYFGGTVSREIGSVDIVVGVGGNAEHIADRAACGDRLVELAQPGDRIVIMGARDDTLSTFAADVLERIGQS